MYLSLSVHLSFNARSKKMSVLFFYCRSESEDWGLTRQVAILINGLAWRRNQYKIPPMPGNISGQQMTARVGLMAAPAPGPGLVLTQRSTIPWCGTGWDRPPRSIIQIKCSSSLCSLAPALMKYMTYLGSWRWFWITRECSRRLAPWLTWLRVSRSTLTLDLTSVYNSMYPTWELTYFTYDRFTMNRDKTQ